MGWTLGGILIGPGERTVSLVGDTAIALTADDFCLRVTSAVNTPVLKQMTGATTGRFIVIHNDSGVSITFGKSLFTADGAMGALDTLATGCLAWWQYYGGAPPNSGSNVWRGLGGI